MGTLVIMAGDGVGPELVQEARRIVEWFATEGDSMIRHDTDYQPERATS